MGVNERDIAVVGGGPAGLYASLLIKQAYPSWELSVYERDPADNTYGWGVVFSDATLSNLREADAQTHERITDAFVRWDPIDIFYAGEHIRCGGHTFAGIMRGDLLSILQDRCRSVGVEMHHETTIDDPRELAASSDLLIGADGLNSVVRESYAETFQPSIDHGSAKFAWFGTDKPFDVFTFIFRENEHGLWRVHAYPGRKSTFIVECTESTWRAAGMDERSEADALAYFERLFDDHLGGHDLLAKLYTWRNFPIVECRTWSVDDEVVLLGDAAHTAHFSIGSGTKLAMEDAIALVDGLREHGTNFSSALNWYEQERRPRVEGLQAAAERSRQYFENVERYRHMPPRQFAYNLLTRSGRISYESLKIRDVVFADDFDRWFERTRDADTHGDVGPLAARQPLLQPLALRDVELGNRLVVTRPPAMNASDGVPSREYLDDLSERGHTGPGMVLTDPVAVTSNGRITPGTPGLYSDAQRDRWTDLMEAVPEETVVGVQLVHAGRRGSMRDRRYGLDRPLPPDDRWELFAPSALPYSPDGIAPTAMTEADLDRIEEAFVEAADRADVAGFDYLQLHMGHGYLLSSFLSPLTNDRDDRYGGDLAARVRFPRSVFEAVRSRWPADKPLGVTLQATDWNLNGFKTSEATVVAEHLAEDGCDLLGIVAGQATIRERPRYDRAVLQDFTEAFRNDVGLPTMLTTTVTTYDVANTLVGAGRADLCTFRLPE